MNIFYSSWSQNNIVAVTSLVADVKIDASGRRHQVSFIQTDELTGQVAADFCNHELI